MGTHSRQTSEARWHWRGWVALIGLVCIFAPAGAQMQAPSALEQAAEHFDRGIQLVQVGSYEQAMLAFEQSYALSGSPAVLYNLGMVYVAVGRPARAIDALTRYLEHEGRGLQSDERAHIEQELERQRARLGVRTIDAQPAVAPAPSVDDVTSPRAATSQGRGYWRSSGYVLGAVGLAAEISALTLYLVSDASYSHWEKEHARLRELEGMQGDWSFDALNERQAANDERLLAIRRNDAAARGLAIGGAILTVMGVAIVGTSLRLERSRGARDTRLVLRPTGLAVQRAF